LKVLELIVTDVIEFFLCLGFTAIGWNICLVRVMPWFPRLGFCDLMLLQLGIDLVLTQVRVNIRDSTKRLLEERK
jgi:hypothetical protein